MGKKDDEAIEVFLSWARDDAQVRKWQREGLPIIKVVAKQDIAAGTELTVDYHWEEFACLCNSSKCRYNRERGKSGEAGSKAAGKRAADPGPDVLLLELLDKNKNWIRTKMSRFL